MKPEELAVGWRNLAAQLKQRLELYGDSPVRLDNETVRDLIEVLSQPAEPVAEVCTHRESTTLDRDAVHAVLQAHNIECTSPGEVTCRGCRGRGWMSWSAYRLHLSEAIMAAARPLPTREQIAEAIDGALDCETDEPVPVRKLADAVLALFSGGVE